eukprot:jgi/Hompol1/5861/HPOL_001115-RA
MEASKLNHEGILNLEQPLIRVPLEQLKKAFRTSQKYIEKEMTTLSTQMDAAMAKAPTKPEEAIAILDTTLTKLQNLKRKLAETKVEEDLYANRTRIRIDHLAEMMQIPSLETESYTRWSKIRLSRILVDYMLRQGLIESATMLAKSANIEELVDIELFTQSRKIEDSLAQKSCTECLQWCNENKSNLKKIKSTLEFNLRLQEYIELVRSRSLAQAITYARKYLTPWSETHMREIQQAMGLLAFNPSTDCGSYRMLYSPSRWNQLIDQFLSDNYTLSCLTLEPLLHTTLQAGLSALKTTTCYQAATKNINCPVCDSDTFGYLAEKLPCSHHVNSCIVCRMSGKIMDADNPPLVLPNGHVYSSLALQEMAARNKGTVRCLSTGAVFQLS